MRRNVIFDWRNKTQCKDKSHDPVAGKYKLSSSTISATLVNIDERIAFYKQNYLDEVVSSGPLEHLDQIGI